MKIALDFDSTLDRQDVQEFAKDCMENDIDVWVVTSRHSSPKYTVNGERPDGYNSDLFGITDKLGIKRSNIIFMESELKVEFFKDKDFVFHLDDCMVELDFINRESIDTLGIHVLKEDWRDSCMGLIYIRKTKEESLDKLKKDMLAMTYDEYMEWLELPYVTEDDLKLAKVAFKELDMPRDYIDIINIKLNSNKV